MDALRSVFDAKIFRLAKLYVQLVRENTHALKPFYSSTFVSMFNRNVSLPNSDTALHVYWTGALRIHGCNGCCKRWYFTFDGAECSGPLPIDGVAYMQTGKSQDLHRVRHIEGHCNNIDKGQVRVGFWIGNCNGYGNADGYTGWNSVSRIFVEEVPKAQA